MKILVTGAAGFIGYHTARALLDRGDTVIGLDNVNPYYDPTLKEARLEQLRAYEGFCFVRLDLADREGMADLFRSQGLQHVIHLAAQAVVRHSLTDPYSYVDGVLRATDLVAAPDPSWDAHNPDTATSDAPWRIYNIGADQPVPLMRFIQVLERELGMEAKKDYHPLQLGDVPETHSDISDLARDTGYQPQVSVEEGVRRFVEWYRWYHQI